MALASPNRPVKDNGTTSWVTDDTLNQTDVEGDFTAITDQVDGNLETVNLSATAGIVGTQLAAATLTDTQVSASADIAPSKLLQTAGAADGSAGLDADIVQSYAGSDAEYNTRADPLDSSATPSIPAHLEDELERVRFVLARYGLGIPTRLTDGTSEAAWYDGLAVGPNLLPNGSFLDDPGDDTNGLGYTVAGAPETWEMLALPRTEGWGRYLHIAHTLAGGGTGDGPTWTLSGLRDQTLYVIEARVLNTVAEVNLVTTGATGTFGDLDLLSGAGADGHISAATDWQTLAGLVETDSIGTDIAVSINPSATTYDLGIAYVTCREVSGSRDDEGTGREHVGVRGGQIALFTSSVSGDQATLRTDTAMTFVVPGDNYQIVLSGTAFLLDGGAGNGHLTLQEDVNEAATWGSDVSVGRNPTGSSQSTPVFYATGVLTAGNTYSYRLDAVDLDLSAQSGTETHHLMGQLICMGV